MEKRVGIVGLGLMGQANIVSQGGDQITGAETELPSPARREILDHPGGLKSMNLLAARQQSTMPIKPRYNQVIYREISLYPHHR